MDDVDKIMDKDEVNPALKNARDYFLSKKKEEKEADKTNEESSSGPLTKQQIGTGLGINEEENL